MQQVQYPPPFYVWENGDLEKLTILSIVVEGKQSFCHLKIYFFGILIILSCLFLRNKSLRKKKKNFEPPLYLSEEIQIEKVLKERKLSSKHHNMNLSVAEQKRCLWKVISQDDLIINF